MAKILKAYRLKESTVNNIASIRKVIKADIDTKITDAYVIETAVKELYEKLTKTK